MDYTNKITSAVLVCLLITACAASGEHVHVHAEGCDVIDYRLSNEQESVTPVP
jgi:hypothetical protein